MTGEICALAIILVTLETANTKYRIYKSPKGPNSGVTLISAVDVGATTRIAKTIMYRKVPIGWQLSAMIEMRALTERIIPNMVNQWN